MKKEFDRWNELKKQTEAQDDYVLLYHARQIRWCRLGANVGFEQDGTGKDFSRPVLIMKGFSRRVCLVVPLTTSTKKNPYHVSVGVVGGRPAFAIISQVRLIDTRRLDTLIETLNKTVFESVKEAVKDML
jgi:mRNA interferase MazF